MYFVYFRVSYICIKFFFLYIGVVYKFVYEHYIIVENFSLRRFIEYLSLTYLIVCVSKMIIN